MNITPEAIQALRTLRNYSFGYQSEAMQEAFNILDNAGVFAAIDEATGYDVNPEPVYEWVSKCTCPGVHAALDVHDNGCPGDPAEYGDSIWVSKVVG